MKVYSRGENHLLIFPNLPQWAVVDDQGLELSNLLFERGLAPGEVVALYPQEQQENIAEMCSELLEIFTESDIGIEVATPLTSRTTIAMISVTDRCNLVCPHCYVDARGRASDELTVSEHRTIAAELKGSLAINPETRYRINLTGGEAFVRKDILDIIQAYLDSGLEVAMSTNALLIDEETAKFLAAHDVTISVSLDGATAEVHDAIRGEGNFDKVLDKIKMLVNTGVRVGINHLVHDGNFHQIEKTVDMAYWLRCTGFNPINLVQLGRACESPLQRVAETEIFGRLSRHVVAHPELLPLFERTSLFSSMGAALLSGVTCVSCGVGNRPCVYIDPEGRVYPCANTQLEEFELGNVRNNTFAEILAIDHPVLVPLRELKVDTLNPKCAGCDVRAFCGGDCRGETYSVTGDVHAPYVACSDRHDSIIELMWIVAKHPELFENRAAEFTANASRAV